MSGNSEVFTAFLQEPRDPQLLRCSAGVNEIGVFKDAF